MGHSNAVHKLYARILVCYCKISTKTNATPFVSSSLIDLSLSIGFNKQQIYIMRRCLLSQWADPATYKETPLPIAS